MNNTFVPYSRICVIEVCSITIRDGNRIYFQHRLKKIQAKIAYLTSNHKIASLIMELDTIETEIQMPNKL